MSKSSQQELVKEMSEEVSEDSGPTANLCIAVFIVSLSGAFHFGYQGAVNNGAQVQ